MSALPPTTGRALGVRSSRAGRGALLAAAFLLFAACGTLPGSLDADAGLEAATDVELPVDYDSAFLRNLGTRRADSPAPRLTISGEIAAYRPSDDVIYTWGMYNPNVRHRGLGRLAAAISDNSGTLYSIVFVRENEAAYAVGQIPFVNEHVLDLADFARIHRAPVYDGAREISNHSVFAGRRADGVVVFRCWGQGFCRCGWEDGFVAHPELPTARWLSDQYGARVFQYVGEDGRLVSVDHDPLACPITARSDDLFPETYYSIESGFAWEGLRCALTTSSEVRCVGLRSLGDGRPDSRELRSALVLGLTDVISISTERSTACALRRNGRVSCWGALGYRCFPLHADSTALSPVDMGLDRIVEIASGGAFTCALDSSGVVSCWGCGWHGTLGRPIIEHSSTPARIEFSSFTPLSGS